MPFLSPTAGPGRSPWALLALASASLVMLGAAPAVADVTASFHCANGMTLTATFTQQPAGVTLALANGKSITLPQALSADGGRYAKGKTEFWNVGNGATFTLAGKKTQCTAQ